MKEWWLDEYGWDTTEEELQQGCQWRHDFSETFCRICLALTKPDMPSYQPLKLIVDLFDAGVIPTC